MRFFSSASHVLSSLILASCFSTCFPCLLSHMRLHLSWVFFVTSSLISVSVLAVSVFFLGFSPFCLIRELPANEAEGFFELVLFLGPNLPAAWQSITSVVYDVFNIFWSIGESSCFHSCCPAFICVALYTCEQVHQEASEGSAFHEPYHLDWDDAMEKSSILLSMKCHVGLKYPRGGCLKF